MQSSPIPLLGALCSELRDACYLGAHEAPKSSLLVTLLICWDLCPRRQRIQDKFTCPLITVGHLAWPLASLFSI